MRGILTFHSETGTEGGYWAFMDGEYITNGGKSWSYSGLHILKDGDYLTVFTKETPAWVIWHGYIKLRQHKLFTEHASGLWIHADQVGESRDSWSRMFFDELPADLVPA